ncbi:MAG: RtcB family protein [Eubacteriales bacterium]|nr:RtcB family protein [Eubacteriales bacterium]
MKVVNGIYTSATIFTDKVEDYAIAQIEFLCNQETFKDCCIRVMPDVHPGKVGTIGFTSTVGDKIMPDVVGIDIGCGITLAKLKQRKAEYQRLDKIIREQIPCGSRNRKTPHHKAEEIDFSGLRCRKHVSAEKAMSGLGTLGGGNHFIELNQDGEGCLYVAIHSGSRSFGKAVTEYYLAAGQKALKEKEIDVPYELTYLESALMEDYVHDIRIVQEYARLNREIMLNELVKGMKWKVLELTDIPHNYLEASVDGLMLRKGAISAKKDEPVVIPINMKEGILLGKGLGNPDWNVSAPHGAGRILKREAVKEQYTVSQFKQEMKGIYCSCISNDTLDEAPFAYRGLEDIREAVKETVDIQKVITPVYNFKAGSR